MWDLTDEKDDDELIYEDANDLDYIIDEKPKKRLRKLKDEKVSENYVSKDEMWNELYSYYKSLGQNYDWETQTIVCKDDLPKISSKLTTIIYDIATKMGYRSNFCTYSWLDEMIGDSIFKMIKAVRDCSFKCYTISEIISTETDSDGSILISFIDKKGVSQKRLQEESDEFFSLDGVEFVKFKANPFGYFPELLLMHI